MTDPLAEGMAGDAAIATSRRRAVPAPEGSERKYKVGAVCMLCKSHDAPPCPVCTQLARRVCASLLAAALAAPAGSVVHVRHRRLNAQGHVPA